MNTKRAGLVLACMLLAGGGTIAQQMKQADIDLQAAIRAETVNGDLKNAIRQYENLIAKYSKDKPLVATALMHMADAYRKMGDAEAQKIYQRIVREFADQTQIAAEAGRRLAGSGAVQVSGVLTPRVVERVGWMGSVTPDGRRFVVSDGRNGDLAILDMTNTLDIKRLMAKTGGWSESAEEGFSPKMSPDSRQIAYIWEQDGPPGRNHFQLRVMANEIGGKPRVLLGNNPDSEYDYYETCGWSADSKSILVILWKEDATRQLAWVSAADGKVKVLRSLEWRIKEFSRPTLSPDGRFIAYSALERSAKSSGELQASSEPAQIYILAADGSTETALTKTRLNEAPIWTPDGAHVLFTSDRSGFVDLWSAVVRDGKPVGAPSIVKSEIGKIRAIGFSASGTYYFGHATHGEGENIFVAELDSAGHVRGPATLAIENFFGSNLRPVLSPDGKVIAFARQPRSALFERNVPPNLTIHSLETGEERTIPLPDSLAGQPAWFSDGKSLLQSTSDDHGGLSFYRVDLRSGEARALVTVTRDGSRPSALSPDGKIAYITDAAVNGEDRQAIRAIDINRGKVTEVFTAPGPRGALPHVAVSPDGRTLAMLVFSGSGSRVQESVSVVSTDGSNFRNIYSAARGELHNPARPSLPCVAWTQDGRSILFPRNTNDGWELMRISAGGGQPESTGLTGKRMNCLDVSPDGSRIVFGDGGVGRRGKLWLSITFFPV